MKILVVGLGYVGLSLGLILSKKNNVSCFDINKYKVEKLKQNISPLKEKKLEDLLNKQFKKINFIDSSDEINPDIQIVVIATPTSFNLKTLSFDTRSIEDSLDILLKKISNPLIVIKSTIPIGYIKTVRKRFNYKKIYFSPEFLREGMSIEDNLSPNRIIIGGKNNDCRKFINLLKDVTVNKNYPVLYTGENEAESIKLFSNTFLANRISFFNEIDSFAIQNNLSTKEIVDGISSDPRIGDYYNNPSFGYGGYCLPKDTKQLLSNFKNTPQKLIKATISSNLVRKKFLAEHISKSGFNKIGFYLLSMKKDSDNSRSSSTIDLIKLIKKINPKIEICFYDPSFKKSFNPNVHLLNSFNDFILNSDLIIANRIDKKIMKYKSKIFTRDIYNRD